MSEDRQTTNQEAASKAGARLGRRTFLTWLGRGSVAAAITAVAAKTVHFMSFQPPASESTILPVGQPDSYPRKTLTYVAEARVYVGNDDTGLYAIDAVCPHLGCLIEPQEDGGFMCPCHDSLFDQEGRALSGPATQPLRHLHLWFDQEQGQLFVDRSEPVESTVRLPF